MDDETKLTLHGLQQYYSKLKDSEKNRKLFDLLDALEFNQVNYWSNSMIITISLKSLGIECCDVGSQQLKVLEEEVLLFVLQQENLPSKLLNRFLFFFSFF